MYPVPAKTYFSKGIQPIFEIFASVRRCWRWAFGWEDFESWFQLRRYFTFAMAMWKPCASTTFEILPLSTCTRCKQKSYISEGIRPIVEILPSARRCWRWPFGWKVSGAHVFYFSMARWKICASTTFEILPLSTCTRWKQKSYISKGIQPIVEMFPSARRCWRWPFGWKVSGAQEFYFCNGKVKTLRIDNIWNFATFNLYPVQAEILYLQRYSTIFRNLCVSSGMLRVGIWVESFRFAGVLLLQWQGENFAHRQHLKFCHYQPVLHASKNPVSPKVFNRFSKSFHQLEDVESGHLGRKFQVRSYFTFAMTRWNFAHRQHLKFCYFQPVHCASKNSISPKIFNQFSKSLPELENAEGGHLGGKFQLRRHFTFEMASESFRIDNILKFCYFQPVHCASINPISPKIFNRFSKTLPQLEDPEGGHLGGKFQLRKYFTFAMARWNFAHRQHLKFCHFQPVPCAGRNPVSPKEFNRFLKCLAQLEDVEGGHLRWKSQARRYFTFATARWKLGASTTFEILPLSTCTLCKQKSYICKDIQPIFEIFPSARRCWRWPFGWKVSGGQEFYFCNGKVKTLRIDNIWNFATFNLYNVQGENLYLQRYPTDFRNLYLSSQMLTVAFWVESFRCARVLLLQWQGESLCIDYIWNFCNFQPVHCARKNHISPKVFNRFSKSSQQLDDVEGGHLCGKFQVRSCFTFAMANWKLCGSTTLEILPLSTCTLCLYLRRYSADFRNLSVGCASKNPISPKVLNRFLKSLPQLEDVDGGHLGGKFQGRRYFPFAKATWKLCASTTFQILILSTCTRCRQKSYISKGIQPIYEIFASARRCWRCPFGWKVSCAHVFCFCNGKVKTWRVDNNWNFATFNLYTVPAKILYLQRYSIDFRNLCLSSKMVRLGIWVESFRCAGILILQWQGENLAHRQHLKFCHVHPVHCASKNPISPKVFNRISKSLPQLEDVDDAHLGEKFHVRRYFAFAMARWKLGASTIIEILPLSTCTRCEQKSYISNGIQPILEIFAPARRCWQWPFGWNVSGAQVFYFCNGKVKTLRIDNILNFAIFILHTVQAEILYLQRYSTNFRNLRLGSKMLTVAIWVKSFRCAVILLLQWLGENLAHRQHLKFCHVQHVH